MKGNRKLWLKNIYRDLKEKIIYKWAQFNHSLEIIQHSFIENGINLSGENYEKSKYDEAKVLLKTARKFLETTQL